MTGSEDEFERISGIFVQGNDDVKLGKMMSSPGLKCNNKVFAFYAKDGMGFRLGADFDPKVCGVKKPKPLNPFKTKPPLKGWYIVGPGECDKWEALTQRALAFTRAL